MGAVSVPLVWGWECSHAGKQRQHWEGCGQVQTTAAAWVVSAEEMNRRVHGVLLNELRSN